MPHSTTTLFLLSKGHCYYCGELTQPKLQRRDHVWPQAKGGLTRSNNLVPACQPCNSVKGTLMFEEFKRVLGNGDPEFKFYGELHLPNIKIEHDQFPEERRLSQDIFGIETGLEEES